MPRANGDVSFSFGTQSQYDSLATKNVNTMYVITDTRRIYIGDVEYTEDNILNAVTKQYIDNAIGGLTEFDYQIIENFPASGKKGVIYLVSNAHGENDTYDEYLWIGNRYEKIGNTDIDLTQYIQKSDMVTLTQAEYDALQNKTAAYYFIIEE
jgi:hypothetical protein